MRVLLLSLLVLSLAALGGCKPELIPGTTVEDSEENRKVLEFLTRYQQAMQNHNADDVIKLVAADYYEDNGNADPKDDYNVDGLRQKLEAYFKMTKELTLEVYVQTIERDEPKAEAEAVAVVYRYNTRALVAFPSGDKWLTATEVNKIKLRPISDDEAAYRIVSGL
ncbi:MAG: hypothetical protein Q8O67_10140 [Deltaproteobacteria bacterium]|nr:hypothetical protein [Deltaproteobacteria bacterium]